jgi:TRAP-type C4-dicarboxylate transport system permease small subunit
MPSYTSAGKWLKNIDKVIALITRAMMGVGLCGVMVIMLVVVVDVFLRAFFNRPILGSTEIVEFMMLVIVSLALPYVQYNKSNIAMDILYGRLREKPRLGLDISAHVLSLGIVSLLTWRSFVHFSYFKNMGSYTPLLKMPVAAFEFLLALGWLILGLVLFLDLLSFILLRRGRE